MIDDRYDEEKDNIMQEKNERILEKYSGIMQKL